MCGSKPCCESVFGLELRLAVITIGVMELLLTLVTTLLNISKFIKSVEEEEDFMRFCEDKDVCIGASNKIVNRIEVIVFRRANHKARSV